MLMLYNSLTRQKEEFQPLIPGKIGLYVCGMTVYDHCHLGHARSMVCFDIIVRFLRYLDYKVNFIRNITDIDDKIILRANERGINVNELTAQYIDALHADAKALNCLPPDQEPRATESIADIIRLIETLLHKQYAYISTQGDVCFAVKKCAEYGKLSHQALDGLLAGARVEVNTDKHAPLDFVLWKRAKPGEPQWSSPWGAGRPGWHIECSAMSMQALGEQFDIHGGGIDLQFPHHENEIAQSESATSKKFANYWLHVGLLQINQEKMAKSLGNFFTIEAILNKYPAEVLRYFLLSSHYRSALNYTESALILAEKSLMRLYQTLKVVTVDPSVALLDSWIEAFKTAMLDDFNTPEALAVLFKLSHSVNKTKSVAEATTLKYLAGILGILQQSPTVFLQTTTSCVDNAWIEAEILKRNLARQAKDFVTADAIRQQLLALDIELEDTIDSTTWRSKCSGRGGE